MSEKFTAEQIAGIARSQFCSIAELKTRLIIQHGKSFYVLGPDGEYAKPIMKGELAQSLRRDLIRIPGPALKPEDSPAVFIDWYKKKGDTLIRKTVDEILLDHCTVARSAVADMSLARSYYDPKDQVMYEAVCPLDNIEPVFNPQIARWLELLAGPAHEKLLDWMATMSQIMRPSCALLLTGKPSAGKEMFAQGLARRWRRAKAPTELARVLDGFNEDLARCPLIFCDENMPASRSGKKSVLADLKSTIASSSRTLSRKFISNADLIGAIRLILAANNNNMLMDHEDTTSNDQEATSLRFLHIIINEAPVEYLKEIGGRNTTEAWVAGGQLAQHVRWLELNRVVVTGTRLLVEGDVTDLQRKLMVNNKNTSLVLEWVVRFLASGGKSTSQVLVGNGEVLINTSAICTNWNQYIKSDFVPSTTRIGTSLRTLSVQEKRIDWTIGGKTFETRYRVIKTEYIIEWAEQNQVGDPVVIQNLIDAKLDIEVMKNNNGTLPAVAVPANGYTNGNGNGANGSTNTKKVIADILAPVAPGEAGRSLLDPFFSLSGIKLDS